MTCRASRIILNQIIVLGGHEVTRLDLSQDEPENPPVFNGLGAVEESETAMMQNPFYIDGGGDLIFGDSYDVAASGAAALSAYFSPAIVALAEQTVADAALAPVLNELVAQTYGSAVDWQAAVHQLAVAAAGAAQLGGQPQGVQENMASSAFSAATAGGTLATGTLANLGQHDWIAVALDADQAYEVTVHGLSQYGSVILGAADSLADDGAFASALPTSNIEGGAADAAGLYFMPAASGTYYIDISDPYPQSDAEIYTVSVAAVTADYTDNATAPGSVAVGGQVGGTLTDLGQHDWIAVALDANQAYEITVDGLSQEGSVTINTADGLAGDSQSASGLPSSNVGEIVVGGSDSLYFMPAASGTYYIDISDPYPQTAAESYSVAVAATTADYTDNATAPGSVTVGGQIGGTLTNLGQHDWIAVALDADRAYEVTVDGLSQFGSITIGGAGELADDGQSASAISSSNVGEGIAGTDSLYFMPAASGTYDIDISDPYPQTAVESYTVAVAATTADYTDNATAPGSVAVGGQVVGTLTNLGQHDWIAVALTANQAYEVAVSGLSEYGSAIIGTASGLPADGQSAAALPTGNIGAFANGGTESLYFMPAASGTYYIDISDPYPLSAAEGYTVAVAATSADYTDNATAPGSVAAVPCFAQGTRIATERGEVAVERLRVGAQVPARFAGRATVAWIGHRRVDCRRHPRPHDVWPVRVRAGAFGAGQPMRDLVLSPDHAVLAEGALIPIRYLINGRTIVQEPRAEVIYWHVELDRHDAIMAEGLACESYLDTGNRGAFENGGAAVQLHADFALRVWQTQACAPLVRAGGALAAVRRNLLDRAERLGHRLTGDPGLRLLAGGTSLKPERDGPRWRFRLPAATQTVRLVSRVWTPAHTRPAEDDTRGLGVAIARLWFDRRAVSLDDPALAEGWHAPEASWRWTGGEAVVAVSGVRELAFDVAIAGTYWQQPARRLAPPAG